MTSTINWFEIPAKNYERAKAFYATVLDIEIVDVPMPDSKYGMLPYDRENNGVGGGIIEHKDMVPGQNGPLIYLNGGEDLSVALSKVEKAGGSIAVPKVSIGENGFMAQIIDTEGNRLALHSMK